VNIVINEPVTRSEAIKIIETTLLLNQFSLVPGEGDIVKVLGLTKNPRSAGVPIISDIADLPEGDKVVTFLLKLHYTDAAEMQQMLAQYVVQSLYTTVVALPKSQALLITESTPVLRSLIAVVKDLDVPPAQVVSEFIQLERADATDVVDKLQTILSPDTSGTATGGPIRQPGRGPNGGIMPPGAGGGSVSIVTQGNTTLSEDSIVVGKVRLTADVRTNRIQVITRPINMPILRGLIQGFDSDAGFQNPYSRILKYVDVTMVFNVLQNALTEPSSNQNGGAPQPTPRQAANTNNQQNSTTGGGSSGSSGVTISEELNTPEKDLTPQSVTVNNNTKLIADPRTNAIIVIGTKEVQKRVSTLIDELDVPAPQVLLNTIIGELTINNDSSLGLNYFLGNKDGGSTTAPTTTTGSTRAGISVSSNGTPSIDFPTIFTQSNLSNLAPFFTGGASGLAGYVAAGDTLGAIVNALESTQHFHIVQRPMVFTSNNKKAIIASGQQIAVPTSSLSNVNNSTIDTASVQTAIEYKDVVLQLEVVPLINSDGVVSLDILQKLDSLTGATTTIGGNSVPTISTRYVRTNVSVPNGATICLGGLIKQDNEKTTTGIPVLSKIPGIGALFRTTTNNKDRSELIILMRPQVVTTGAGAIDLAQKEQQRLHIEPDVEATIDAVAHPAKKVEIQPAAQPSLR
jgi:type II secretion system protein D